MTKRATKGGLITQLPNAYGRPFWVDSLHHSLAISLLWCSVVSVLSLQSAVADSSDAFGREGRWKNLGNGALKDAWTKQEWLQDDNGDDIDWKDAKTYCEGRHHGWRLPRVQELKSIYDATQVGKDSTDGIELASGVLMANGAQTQTVRDASYGSRVLCVRDP